MGIAVGDYRNNGEIDIFNTTFSDDYKVLYRNDGDANFTDISDDAHIADMTIPFLGWGTAFLDYDNDGWKDLLEVNGHVYKNADTNNWGTSWAERPLLFHNDAGKHLDPSPPSKALGWPRSWPRAASPSATSSTTAAWMPSSKTWIPCPPSSRMWIPTLITGLRSSWSAAEES